MNKVTLLGRIVRDPEVRYSTGENATAIARFSVAVNRKFKNAEGNYEADFINCVSFGKQAELIEKYFKKGSQICLSGRIQTGSYTNKEGNKVYTTDVVVEELDFVGSKSDNANASSSNSNGNTGFMDIPDVEEGELPFK